MGQKFIIDRTNPNAIAGSNPSFCIPYQIGPGSVSPAGGRISIWGSRGDGTTLDVTATTEVAVNITTQNSVTFNELFFSSSQGKFTIYNKSNPDRFATFRYHSSSLQGSGGFRYALFEVDIQSQEGAMAFGPTNTPFAVADDVCFILDYNDGSAGS